MVDIIVPRPRSARRKPGTPEAKAHAVCKIAHAYAHRRRYHIPHTAHTVRRLLEAVSELIERRITAEPDAVLTALKAIAAAVALYARTSEHVEGLGAPFHTARRAIAKAEGRCSHFDHLPAEGAGTDYRKRLAVLADPD